ncbi:MAG: hypothetical protein ACJ741_18665 [Pyrinomonadaceae bacterium]
MRRRQITLDDGRYLIFFTFEDEPELNTDGRDRSDAARAEEHTARQPDIELRATQTEVEPRV